jgi:hypothetical protein
LFLHSFNPLILHFCILWETKIKLLVLRTAGILFPILVMVRALATYHRRRRQQVIPALIEFDIVGGLGTCSRAVIVIVQLAAEN